MEPLICLSNVEKLASIWSTISLSMATTRGQAALRWSAQCTPRFQFPVGFCVFHIWVQCGPWHIRVSCCHPSTHISISPEGCSHGEADCKTCRVVTRIYKAVTSNKVVKGNIDMKEISMLQKVLMENYHPWYEVLHQCHQPLLFVRSSQNVRQDLGDIHVCGNITDHT